MVCPVNHTAASGDSAPQRTQEEQQLQEIPQPPKKYLTANLGELDPTFIAKSFWRLADIYGPILKLELPYGTLLVVSSWELVNELCNEERFGKLVPAAQVEIRSFLGNGLFTSDTDDPDWAKAHRLLVPVFGPLALRKMFGSMMDIASQLILKLAFDTIGICGFGYRFNSFYQESPVPFATQMGESLIEGGKRSLRLPLENHLRIWSTGRYRENIAAMNKLCDDLIAERKANPKPDAIDMLNVMLNTSDPETHEKLSDENIRYQLMTFLVAGHETTSGTLAFLLYNLLTNPETYHKAQQEVDDVLGDNALEAKHLPQFKYVEACIRETLRFMGPINAINLHAKEPTVLGGKYRITPDQSITINIRGLHHDHKVWGDDADDFRPERLLNGGFESLPPNAWKPFGNGMRACIGRAFAEQEMLINAALILQRFTFVKADPSYKLALKSTLTIKPDGFGIKVRRREGKGMLVGLQATPSAKATAAPASHSDGSQKPSVGQGAKNKTLLTIAWGSNAGTCKAFAEELQSNASDFGFTAEMKTLDEIAEHVPTDHPVIFVTPSYEGKPPDNGKKFVSWLETNATSQELSGVQYCVFGAGNSEWNHTFHRIPKLVDDRLKKLGGKQLLPFAAVDVRQDAVGPFEDWSETLWKALRTQTGVREEITTKELSVKIEKSETPDTLIGGEVTIGTVQKNEQLTGTEVGPAKRHMDVLLPAGTNYRSGDYLVILPYNSVELVRRVLTRFRIRGDDQLFVSDTNKTYLTSKHPESAFDFFVSRVELSTPASRRQVAALAAATPEGDRKELDRLQADDVFEKEVLGKRYSVLDLLEDFPTCSLELRAFLDMLKPLMARQYSISSSPLASAGMAHAGTSHRPMVASVTYDVLEAPALSGHGRRYHGTATTYMALCEPGNQIRCWVRETNANFHLPTDLETPIIMICAGSGLAPMRAFIQSRAAVAEAEARKLGPAVLYFGCRDFEKDYIYKDELEKWHKDGIVSVRPAFSRRGPPDAKQNFKYAPDRIWAERDEVAKLFRDGAKIFVCGSASKLAKSTGEVCQKIWLERNPGKTEKDSIEWLQEVKQDRFVSDVFG